MDYVEKSLNFNIILLGDFKYYLPNGFTPILNLYLFCLLCFILFMRSYLMHFDTKSVMIKGDDCTVKRPSENQPLDCTTFVRKS